MENYIEINRKSWDAKVDPHLKSDFYFVNEFIKGRTSLNSIELELLEDVKGKEILHLQCHFGQDSISLARLGAEVTAVDFSGKAIAAAEELNTKCNTNVEFIVSDVYELNKVLHKKFDIVYSSYGVIGWLPDLEKWAKLISGFLKPGGKLVFVEFHPFVWMYDDDFTMVKYNYFNEKPIAETYEGTYADQLAPIVQDYVMWNHPTSEVLQSLLNENLELETFREYNWSPYPCFKHNEEFEKGKFRIPQFGGKIPIVFSLVAQKKTNTL